MSNQLDVATFVNAYWKKVRRSGQSWTAQAIVDDSGMDKDAVNEYLYWLDKNAQGLTDAEAIDKFNGGWHLFYGAFEWVIEPLPVAAPSSSKTLASFLQELSVLEAKYK